MRRLIGNDVNLKAGQFHVSIRDGFQVLESHSGGYPLCCMEDLSSWNAYSSGTWNTGGKGQTLYLLTVPDSDTNLGTNFGTPYETLDSLVGKIPILGTK